MPGPMSKSRSVMWRRSLATVQLGDARCLFDSSNDAVESEAEGEAAADGGVGEGADEAAVRFKREGRPIADANDIASRWPCTGVNPEPDLANFLARAWQSGGGAAAVARVGGVQRGPRPGP